jgi:Uma2 family endonuclease
VYVPPDLAVEVLSPSTARIDRGKKSALLAKHRVPEYWLVDPQERTLEVRIERAGSYPDPILLAGGIYQSVTLPGLTIDLEALFA